MAILGTRTFRPDASAGGLCASAHPSRVAAADGAASDSRQCPVRISQEAQRARHGSRGKIIAHFHPTQIYEHAIVAEHTIYVQKAASYLCASHLGTDHVHDAAFLDPMQHYEELFEEYFEVYCGSLMCGAEEQPVSQASLLPLLKHQLSKWRWVILNPKQGLPLLRRESELRRPSGDTQRMRVLKIHKIR